MDEETLPTSEYPPYSPTQCTDLATEDPGVAEVGVHDIDDINADVHANGVQAPEGDTILFLKV